MGEIILVTGCDRTRSWVNVAFLESDTDSRVSFGVDVTALPVTGDNGLGVGIDWRFSPDRNRGAVLSRGPVGKVCYRVICENQEQRQLCYAVPTRTYQRINAYLYEGTASLVPSRYFPSRLKQRLNPRQTRTSIAANQNWSLQRYPLLPRSVLFNIY